MKNTTITLALFAIVASMIAGSLPSSEAATGDSTLLRIANQALDQVQNQIKSSRDVSPEIKKLFEQGSQEVKLLKISIDNQDSQEARKHFLSAMEIFKKITQSSQRMDAQPAAASQAIALKPDLSSEIDKLEQYVSSLKSIAKTHNVEIDFSQVDKLFDLANQQNNEGSYDAAVKTIDDLKRIIIDINKVLREDATQKKTEKARSFAQKYITLLDKLISEMNDQGYSDDIIRKISEAKERLANSSDPEEIIKEVRQILSFKEQFDLIKVDRIKDRLNQLEKSLDKLSSKNVDQTKLDEALKMAEKLRAQLKDGQYDSAQETLKTLTDLVRSLEKSNSS